MLRRTDRTPLLLAIGLLMGLSSQAGTAQPQPVDELLRLLPEKPAFCFVLRDVRGHSARLADSPFFTQFKDSPITSAIGANQQINNLVELDKQLNALLGAGFKELRDEVLGDGFVFAYWPAQGSDPERGVFLAKARRADLLAKLVAKLRELGEQSGDLKSVSDGQHEGWNYHHLKDKDDKSTFYFLKDQLLAVTEDEQSLKRVIDRARTPQPPSPIVRQLEELGLREALAVLLVNPRSFDAEIDKKSKNATEEDAAVVRVLNRYWRSTDAIALSLRLDQDAALGLSLKLKPSELPESTRRWLAQSPRASEVWRHFPERTMFAAAGEADFSALADLLKQLIPDAKREKDLPELEKLIQNSLGLDFYKEVLPNLGPDWGLFVSAPSASELGWFPHAVLALRVQHKPEHRPLDEAAFESLRTLVGVIAITQSKPGKPLTVKTHVQDGLQMVTLNGPEVFPLGCRPTLALKAGYLLAASSPEAIAAFRASPRPALPDSARSVIARVSFKEIAVYARQPERRRAIAQALQQAHGLPAKDVSDGLDKIAGVLDLFDRVELVQQHTADQVHVTLHFHPVKAFRK